jgi:GH35 family endo-1,4-beta-xylanase
MTHQSSRIPTLSSGRSHLARFRTTATSCACVLLSALAGASAEDPKPSAPAHRMGTLVIQAAPNTPVRVHQERHEFWFGATLPGRVFGKGADPAQFAQFEKTFLANFNAAVTESALKWHMMESKRGRVDYTVVDAMLAWTDAHELPLRGHNVFWGVPNRVPAWQKELDDDELTRVLRDRALDIGRRYRGRFAEYDLNNEMMHANYYEDRLGPGITRKMAEWIRSEDPGAQLYLNDYDILTGNKLEEFIAHAKRFREDGPRFDGIGVQGHLHGDSFDPGTLRKSLDALAELHMPIRITEFNFPGQRSRHYGRRGAPLTAAEEEAKAKALVEYYRICFGHPAVEGILMWGFWEGANWIPVSSLYRRDWTPTPAARAYRDLVFGEWWTDWNGKTDPQGRCVVPAFFGSHRVRVGENEQVVDLRKKDGTLTVGFRSQQN